MIGAAVGEDFLTVRAGLILGPYDYVYRLGWWLDRIARGGRVVVPAEGWTSRSPSWTPVTWPAGWSRWRSRAARGR
ncbi:hypothetical protein [Blastococcus brunescens]|uniref:Uncharacterized protein n=1 Tax=Blastococcus brunescens TaxID=1564165 RepID=A0ABZ1B2P5_9ACTN|nr:hypothetical protein [Blastococcus sp. BMG 8361]WRL65075.1 hypothetical protein U6N30_05130 [Blastococcus sp. BMG 8361]